MAYIGVCVLRKGKSMTVECLGDERGERGPDGEVSVDRRLSPTGPGQAGALPRSLPTGVGTCGPLRGPSLPRDKPADECRAYGARRFWLGTRTQPLRAGLNCDAPTALAEDRRARKRGTGARA